MKFSDQLWQKTLPIFQEIIEHPFLVELGKGTLNQERFHFYLGQDVLYLTEFTRVMAIIASRSESIENIRNFLTYAIDTLEFQKEFLKQLAPYDPQNSLEPTLTGIAYSRYLIATASTCTLEEALAATLPCFWIYREIGKLLSHHLTPDNPYAALINMYTTYEYSEFTDQAIELINQTASETTQKRLVQMEKAFEYSYLFEWHFWNDAYNMTTARRSIADHSLTGIIQ